MGTRTIGLDDEAYERLDALKREDESFSDLVKRLTEEASSDWRLSFGKYSDEEGERLERAVEASRDSSARGLAVRQEQALELFRTDQSPGDETNAGGAE